MDGTGPPTEIACLYVDDDAALAELTQEFLERERETITVETVSSAFEALDRIDDTEYDVVVSDYQMPEMDGLEFLETLREDRGNDVPFIIFTGQGREEVAMEALNLGADRYLQKGGDPTAQYGVLARAIEQAVAHRQASERLEEQNRRLDITLESIGDAVIATDADGRVERLNDVAESLTGWDRADAAGRPLEEVFDIISEETRQPAENPVEQVLDSGESVDLANGTVLISKTGEERYIADSAAPITDTGDEIRGVVLVFRDVTDEYEAQRRKERQRETVVDLSTAPSVVDGEFEAACRQITERAAAVLGVERASVWLLDGDELICRDCYRRSDDAHTSGRRLDADCHGAYVEAIEARRSLAIEDVDADERLSSLRDQYLQPNGVESLLDGTIRSRGEVVGIVSCESTTEQRDWRDDEVRFVAELADRVRQALLNDAESGDELTRKDERLRHLFEQSPLAVIEWTRDFCVDRWNSRAEELFGYTTAEAVGRHASFIIPGGIEPEVQAHWETLLDEGENRSRVNENIRKDGETVVCEWHNRPITDDGEVVGVLSLVRDVTEEREQSRQFRALVENTNEAVFIKDTEGRYEFINEAGADYFDADPSDIVGTHDGDLFDLDDDQRLLEADREVLSKEEPVEEEQTYRIDGEEYVFLSERRPHYDEYGNLRGLVGISRDVTDRKRTETVLAAVHAVATDTDRPFDERATELIDTLREALGLSGGRLIRVQENEPCNEAVVAAGTAATVVHADVPFEETLCGRVVADEEPLATDDLAGAGGKAETAGCHLGTPVYADGSLWGVLCLTAPEPRPTPFSSTERRLVELVAEWLGQELSEREKRRELRRRNEALEDIINVLSHDIQSPLSAARGRLDLAGDSEHVDRAARLLEDIDVLVEDALTLAQQGWEISATEPQNLAAVTRRVWKRLDADEATLVVADDEPLEVAADESALELLLQNLLGNAIEHGGEGVTVTVGCVNDCDTFYVEDDGPGIDRADRQQVFEHGYTTAGNGTGLGLTIVQRIADAHGWSVTVTESDAGGARFEISGCDSLSL